MKKAIVLLAREEMPFKMCKYFLERDYEVFAIDEQQFEKAEYEEKWLSVGRNAHIHFQSMNAELHLRTDDTKNVIFIPISLYEKYNNQQANENVLIFLRKIVNNQKKVKMIIMWPDNLSMQNQDFYKKFAMLIQKQTCMIVVTNKN